MREVRKINSAIELAVKFLNLIQDLEIEIGIFEDDGKIWISCEALSLSADGADESEAVKNLISAMRLSSEAYAENLGAWIFEQPGEFFYVMKILLSSDEEIKSCMKRKRFGNF